MLYLLKESNQVWSKSIIYYQNRDRLSHILWGKLQLNQVPIDLVKVPAQGDRPLSISHSLIGQQSLQPDKMLQQYKERSQMHLHM